MKRWTPEHEALRNALQAASIVPSLFRRLSLERYTPKPEEIRRLRDWATSLRSDPGWTMLEPVLERPAAWPDVWQAGADRGFSPRTDHHNALLLGRFCERFLQARDYEGAAWAWRESVASWARIFRSDYPGALMDALAPKLGPDGGATREGWLMAMLDGVVEARVEDLRVAAGLTAPAEVPSVERRLLRFATRALEDVIALSESDDPYGTLQQVRRLSLEGIGRVNAEVLHRFEAMGETVDLSVATEDAVTGRFRWAATYFEIVGRTEGAVTTLVSEAVTTCWALRKLDRDERPEFSEILAVVEPFNRDLARRLLSFESAFGHNGPCADFFVFLGELEKDPQRKVALFREGLAVCPGHRNSAMLAAWSLVTEARTLLLQVAVAPRIGSVGPTEKLLRRGLALCDEAEALYAFNKDLPEVREKLLEEMRRRKIRVDPG